MDLCKRGVVRIVSPFSQASERVARELRARLQRELQGKACPFPQAVAQRC